MNNQQVEEIETLEDAVFSESSDIVQVGFSTDKTILLQIAKAASCMNENATFTINEEGLTYREMDPSHVSLLDISIPNSCFEKWSCIDETKFAVNIREFKNLINSLDAKGSIHVEIQDENILIKQNGFSASLKTIDVGRTDVPLPHINYESSIKFSQEQEIKVADFVKMIRKIDSVCELVTINANESRVIFSTDEKNGKCSMEYSDEECEISIREDSETSYNVNQYLMPFLRTLNNTEIEIEFTSAKPIRIRQRLINSFGRIDFYLAPRVEN